MIDDGEQLARAFQDGDQAAFGDLIDVYQERFYRVSYRVLGRPEEALDVVQDAFVKIHARIGTWDRESRFSSWAYRIVTNLAIDGLRRKTRERKAVESRALQQPEYLEDGSADSLLAEEQRELVARVKDAIEQLPDGQRAVVALRHYEGFSLKDIAEVRGCALGTVKSTLHQAFRSLRKTLGVEFLEHVAVSRPGS
jgi:RNA polymerase sigma-70 factor (ECF subfamily)